MNLKKSIIVVNEYTVKMSKGGTRGGTPGDYVLRYMARDDAVEGITPIQKDTENFILRYMARDEAVDKAESVSGLKKDMRSIQGDGGVAFGYGDFSLSHKKLKAAAKDIQKNFDNGKTVMKTVLSFEEEYLRERGIIDPDFKFDRSGDYKGNIDQLKLRMSIMNGLDKLSNEYDDLQYIGVIQVDTKHVHCHLAMVDRGEGTLMPDGTQRGKITDKGKDLIRRGIDNYLDQNQTVKMMASSVDHDKRNTICFVKKYTNRLIEERGLAQFMMACLPEDRRLWRAGSNSQEMRKPNAIVREYVQEILKQPGSGYEEAMQKVDQYARTRAEQGDHSGKTYRELYRKGNNRIIEEGMNCVYASLKQIPQDEFCVRTPMMEVMSMPYEELASEAESDPLTEFGFKLRSYKSRLDHHKNERRKYHEAAEDYKKREADGDTDAASRPLFTYFEVEEEYNTMLMAKYQHFLSFIPPSDEYQQEFDEFVAYDRRTNNTRKMLRDPVMKGMKEDSAEEYGQQVYNESGGHYVVSDQEVLERRLHDMMMHRDAMRRDFEFHIKEYGMEIGPDDEIIVQPAYAFDDVKALDMHHLMYDFPHDFEVSLVNADKFTKMADKRYNAFQNAKSYLVRSGQADTLASLPEADIKLQKFVADRFRTDNVFRSARKDADGHHVARTIRLDNNEYYREREDQIKNYIKESINDLQFDL